MIGSIMQHELVDDEILVQGMKVQLHKWKGMLESGCKRVGWKIGFNDLADQKRMRLASPIVGFLTSKSVLESGGIYKAANKTARLMVEAEVAILLGQDVCAGADKLQVSEAISGFAPAIEIVDIARSPHDITSILEDNIFHETVILGEVCREYPDLVARDINATVLVNEQAVQTGDPSRYPEDISEVVSVVADTLAKQGECLRVGDWIISGSITKPIAVQPDDQVEVSLSPLGALSVKIMG